MPEIILYGIHNCDTVKKARQWLDQHSVSYKFHDFRKDGLSADQIKVWIDKLGWTALVNKRSTTWKTLDHSVRDTLNDQSAIEVILASPTLIKRPLLVVGEHCCTGFKVADYQALLL